LFRYRQGVIDLDAEIPDRAFDLGMPEQELDGPEIARPPVDQGRFCASQRVGSEQPRVEPDAANPVRDEACILAGGHAVSGTATTRKQELAGPFVGGLQIIIDGLAGLFTQFKSDGPPGFLLPNRRSIRRVPAGGDILDPDGDDITAAKLAVDGQIEHGEVASAAFDLEFRPDRPNMFGSQRRLGSGQLAFVSRQSLGRVGRILLILHGYTPRVGYRGEKPVPPDRALEPGRFSGQSGLRSRPTGKRNVANDPQRKSARIPALQGGRWGFFTFQVIGSMMSGPVKEADIALAELDLR
jgi:hypothetical protein